VFATVLDFTAFFRFCRRRNLIAERQWRRSLQSATLLQTIQEQRLIGLAEMRPQGRTKKKRGADIRSPHCPFRSKWFCN